MARGWMSRSMRLLDHDPEIDKFKTMWRKQHLKESDFAVLAGLMPQTIHRMFDGQTKRPQGLTYQKMAKAMGCEYSLHQEFTPDYDKEVAKARAEFKEYKVELAKKRKPRKKKRNGA